MSRIGRKPVTVLDGVKIAVQDSVVQSKVPKESFPLRIDLSHGHCRRRRQSVLVERQDDERASPSVSWTDPSIDKQYDSSA